MKLKHLILATVFVSCAYPKNYTFVSSELKPVINQLYNFEQIQPKTVEQCKPGKRTIEHIISNVFNSGFFKQNDLVKREILNNSYGIFDHDLRLCDDGKACFIHNSYSIGYKTVDTILFDKNNFCKDNNDMYKIIFLNETLVHELLHDYWYNVLTAEERRQFTVEAKKFYKNIVNTWSSQQKIAFLESIGVKNPLAEFFKPYYDIALTKVYYPDKKFFGTELFAILGAKTYGLYIIMPKQFRKYYTKIIKTKALNRDNM